MLPAPLDDPLAGLTGRALTLATERPFAWQQRLFGALLAQAYDEARDLRRQYDLNILFGRTTLIDEAHAAVWFSARLQELLRLTHNAEQLVNVALPAALDLPDLSRSVIDIRDIAHHLARVYRGAIAWTLRIRCVQGRRGGLHRPLQTLASTSEPIIAGLGDWMSQLHHRLDAAAETRSRSSEAGNTPDFSLRIAIPAEQMERLVGEVDAELEVDQ